MFDLLRWMVGHPGPFELESRCWLEAADGACIQVDPDHLMGLAIARLIRPELELGVFIITDHGRIIMAEQDLGA